MDITSSLESAASALYQSKKREKELKANPDTLEIICSHVANGGSLAYLCERTWKCNYGRMAQWINSDETRRNALSDAISARLEWERERILSELRTLGLFDIRDILGPDHCVLPPSEWPDHISRAIESMEVVETWEQGPDGGKVKSGEIKKIKLSSKLKALELLGKTSALYIERVAHVVKPMTLGELVSASFKIEEEREVTSEPSPSGIPQP